MTHSDQRVLTWFEGDLYVWPLRGSLGIVFGRCFEARILDVSGIRAVLA